MTNLIDQAEELRMQLVTLIHEMKSFDEQEITKRFREATGNKSLGLAGAIKEFLSDLTEYGVLRYEDFRYTLKE